MPDVSEFQLSGARLSNFNYSAHTINPNFKLIHYYMSSFNGVFGYIAGMANAALLQPLENIKMAIILPPSKLKLSNNFVLNVFLSAKYIYKEGGISQFYDGLISNVLKTGTSSAVYFFTMRKLEQNLPQNSIVSNFIASGLARVASSLVANPLSVLETRYQLSGEAKWQGKLGNNMKRIYFNEGITGFYKGGLTSCYKQGSFAGLYYVLYVSGKGYGFSSFGSGMGSGIISTIVTHPFEIIRASLQGDCSTQMRKQSIINRLSFLFERGQLLKGVAPRIIKKPLANTISFLIFEALETTQNGHNRQ